MCHRRSWQEQADTSPGAPPLRPQSAPPGRSTLAITHDAGHSRDTVGSCPLACPHILQPPPQAQNPVSGLPGRYGSYQTRSSSTGSPLTAQTWAVHRTLQKAEQILCLLQQTPQGCFPYSLSPFRAFWGQSPSRVSWGQRPGWLPGSLEWDRKCRPLQAKGQSKPSCCSVPKATSHILGFTPAPGWPPCVAVWGWATGLVRAVGFTCRTKAGSPHCSWGTLCTVAWHLATVVGNFWKLGTSECSERWPKGWVPCYPCGRPLWGFWGQLAQPWLLWTLGETIT